MTERDRIFNEILDVVQKQNAPVGLVKAVLDEVNCEISRATGEMNITQISEELRKRKPRE